MRREREGRRGEGADGAPLNWSLSFLLLGQLWGRSGDAQGPTSLVSTAPQ